MSRPDSSVDLNSSENPNQRAGLGYSRVRGAISDWTGIVVRYPLLIASCSLAGALLALIPILASQPLYRAATVLAVPSSGEAAAGESLHTQSARLQAMPLLEKTASALRIEPHSPALDRADTISRLRRTLHLGAPRQIAYDALIDQSMRTLTVQPLPAAGRIQIVCDSWSAAFAAKFCNTLATRQQAMNEPVAAAPPVAVPLSEQAVHLQAELRASRQRLSEATAAGTQTASLQSVVLSQERLRQLGAELLQAEQDRRRGDADPQIQHRLGDLAKRRQRLLAVAYDAQEANVAESLKKMSGIESLRRQIDSEQTLYDALTQPRETVSAPAGVQVIQPAQVPEAPLPAHGTVPVLSGLALGSLAGIGLSFYRDRRSRLFRAPGDLARGLRLTELGAIPTAGEQTPSPGTFRPAASSMVLHERPARPATTATSRTRWDDPASPAAESYRYAALALLPRDPVHETQVYTIASPSQNEGRTTVAANLAVALSKVHMRVVAIDGDLRRPALHTAFSVENDYGLREILSGDLLIEIAGTDQLCKLTRFPNLQVIPAGTGYEHPADLLRSPRLTALLTRLAHDFDVILIDTPPILTMLDARILATVADAAILIVRAGVTGQTEARAARDLLAEDGIPILGGILNGLDRESEAASWKKPYAEGLEAKSA